MKQVLFFYMNGCPYCRQASIWMDELMREHPEYASVPLRRVEEREERAFADSFDYYLVPTFYVDGVKVHEGAATKEAVEAVFQKALA
jgi:glutaredoxin